MLGNCAETSSALMSKVLPMMSAALPALAVMNASPSNVPRIRPSASFGFAAITLSLRTNTSVIMPRASREDMITWNRLPPLDLTIVETLGS